VSPDETLRAAARLLRQGAPVEVFVQALDEDAKVAIHEATRAPTSPTPATCECGHPWEHHSELPAPGQSGWNGCLVCVDRGAIGSARWCGCDLPRPADIPFVYVEGLGGRP
jgi:hypothetical protein